MVHVVKHKDVVDDEELDNFNEDEDVEVMVPVEVTLAPVDGFAVDEDNLDVVDEADSPGSSTGSEARGSPDDKVGNCQPTPSGPTTIGSVLPWTTVTVVMATLSVQY
jgi:hypothetical protein